MVANPSYYLDDFADEINPRGLADTTLQGWADWLSRGGDNDPHFPDNCWTFDPPRDGTIYKASCLTFGDDLTVKLEGYNEDGDPLFTWSAPFNGCDFAAMRWAPGHGWDAEDILFDTGSQESVEAELADPSCPKLEVGDDALIAVASNRNLNVIYRANPPRLEEVING